MRENQNEDGWAKLVCYYATNNEVNNCNISKMLKLYPVNRQVSNFST